MDDIISLLLIIIFFVLLGFSFICCELSHIRNTLSLIFIHLKEKRQK